MQLKDTQIDKLTQKIDSVIYQNRLQLQEIDEPIHEERNSEVSKTNEELECKEIELISTEASTISAPSAIFPLSFNFSSELYMD
jgi:hypothetical protein